jgi:hypothetical protein
MAATDALNLLRPHLANRRDGFKASVATFIAAQGRAVAWRAAEELDALLEPARPRRRTQTLKHLAELQHDLWSALIRDIQPAPGGDSGASGVREPRSPRPAAPVATATLEVPPR